ncbi:MAG TPA: PLP-dependent aminotransferase family protein [Bryobacteraceae bacterium]|nr:PLP-dependent aminotransferase family protein [Bryobacteraceae bacterium]
MAKTVSSFELTLHRRPQDQTRADWLYNELRTAILEGRLKYGARLPATRYFARLHGLSRGIVVTVFERLQTEGYLSARSGTGTWVSQRVQSGTAKPACPPKTPVYAACAISRHPKPKPFIGWVELKGGRPFHMRDPDLAHFPAKIWARIASRRIRDFGMWLRADEDRQGYGPLREAIAQYLGSSRGVRCSPDQIVLVSGIQQALDLLARFLVKPGDEVWMEDPGYFGACVAFGNAGANLVPVLVDEQGLSVSAGIHISPRAKGVFLTPAHQFPLGMTMSLERRMEILSWASHTGAFIIEDDYDSEYRFQGKPTPALQGLDRSSTVIFIGTFNKLLFRTLRLGYIVVPPVLIDSFVSFRRQTEFCSMSLDQIVLREFIAEGHFGRHLRRTRDLYAGRLATLMEGGRRYLDGILDISTVQAGLYTAAFLRNGLSSHTAEMRAAAVGIETKALDRFTLQRPDPMGLLLGFAAFDEAAIYRGVAELASALGRPRSRNSA